MRGGHVLEQAQAHRVRGMQVLEHDLDRSSVPEQLDDRVEEAQPGCLRVVPPAALASSLQQLGHRR